MAKYERLDFIRKYNKKCYNESMYEILDETSLARIWQHSKNGFFMMSSFRGDDFKENMKKHEQLKKDLKKYKLGYTEIDGQYQYDDGTVENELSVFVPYRDIYEFDKFIDISKSLGKKYGQESILVKYSTDLGGDAILLYPSSDKIEKIGTNVGYDKISFAYSKLRKGKHKDRTFIIEGFRVPQNHINAYKLKNEGMIY